MTVPGFDPAEYDIGIEEAQANRAEQWADVVAINEEIAELEAKIARMKERYANGENIDPAVIARAEQKLKDLKALKEVELQEWESAKGSVQTAKKAKQDAKKLARQNYQEYRLMAQAVLPWLPDSLIDVWATSWAEYGNADIALAMVRNTAEYDAMFPGIKREDGSLRMDEQTYLGTLWGYRDVLSEFGVNPANFESLFVDNIIGEVSTQEFRQRVTAMHERIIAKEAELAETYAEYFGGYDHDTTISGLLAMALDPSVNIAVLERRISIAEIGGQGAIRGYDIGADLATRLYNQGVELGGARQLFVTAAQLLQSISAAGLRNLEGIVTITDFLEGEGLGEAEDVRRLNRIRFGETSRYTEQTPVRGNQQGALIGYQPR